MKPIFEECHEKELKKYRQKFGTMLFHDGHQTERKEFFNNYIDQEPKTCNQSPNQTRLEKNKFSLSLSNLQTQRSLVQSSARKSQHDSRRLIQKQTVQVNSINNNLNYEFSFPKWISERNDFQKWKSHRLSQSVEWKPSKEILPKNKLQHCIIYKNLQLIQNLIESNQFKKKNCKLNINKKINTQKQNSSFMIGIAKEIRSRKEEQEQMY